MTVMDTVLCNEPEVKRLALAALEECTDLQAFGRRCLEILLNSLVSAKADEACGAPYGERSPGRTNSRNGYRERGLLTPAGDIRVRIPKLRTGTFFPEDLIERYWIGYTKLDSFVRAGRVRRSPWRTRSTPGISPTSSSGR